MTNYQKRQYEIRYEIEDYICYKSGKPAIMIAHRLSNGKSNRKLYGRLIDHNFNLVPVSDMKINDSFNIGNNPEKCRKLISLIENNIYDLISAKVITSIIEN